MLPLRVLVTRTEFGLRQLTLFSSAVEDWNPLEVFIHLDAEETYVAGLNSLNFHLSLGVVAYIFNLSIQEVDLCELEVTLTYMMSSRPATAT